MIPPLVLLSACAAPWTVHDLAVSSDHVGDTYDVRVVVPDGAAPAEWPVVVFQDGDYFPRYEGVLARALDDGAPPFVVVAVGYQGFHTGLSGGLSGDTLDRRLRDITDVPIEGYPDTGGARGYQAFLDEELLPAVAGEVGLSLAESRDRRATYGFSAFGLAVTQGLLWGSATYGGSCAGSPSLRRFDEPIFDPEDDPGLGTLEGWASFTVGDEEGADAQALDDLLDWLDDGDQPALEIRHEVFAGRNHRRSQKPAFEGCLAEIAARW